VLTLCTVVVLRIGIVLLGLRLSLAAAIGLGVHALPVVLICITSALVIVTFVSRAMGMSRELAALIAVGTSICGVTAIVAMAPLTPNDAFFALSLERYTDVGGCAELSASRRGQGGLAA
jgi:uncharacterized membrane protein YadS